ncbi:hypothetical protein KUV75_08895 [Qipengyuania gaetbuli]|nr:hypothetical protein [Qipengyuania gaetbuli]MBY6015019.1 hypothetical protein [Qipengyuania gaetbuli]
MKLVSLQIGSEQDEFYGLQDAFVRKYSLLLGAVFLASIAAGLFVG